MAPLPASRKPFFLLLSLELVVAAALLAGGPSPAAASWAFLQKKCSEVDKPAVCRRILSRQRWAIGCGDTKCLALGTLNNICLPWVRRALDFAERSRSRSPANEEAWETCVNAYDALQSDLQDSVDELNNGDADEASRILAGVDHYTSDCESAFKSNRPSPMRSWNDMVSDAVELGGDFVLFLVVEGGGAGSRLGSGVAASAAPTGSIY